MPKYIVNQDRDRTYPIDIMSLHPRFRTDLPSMVQLTMECDGETVILGDFDTLGEVVDEVRRICDCKDDVYYVSGFAGEGWED